MSNFGKVAVLMGGRSAEREISLKSGSMVLAALKRKGVDAHAFDPREQGFEQLIAQRFARVFIALHGRFGEDGTVQGALEYLGIPYTGSGVMASALAMDKWRTKLAWLASGIPTPVYELLTVDSKAADVAARLGLPLMVKPAHEGSSIGITKVDSIEKIDGAYELAAKLDDTVIAEQFIAGSEITAAILGNEALPLVRIEAPQGNYDYHNKYFGNETKYHCPSGLPADLEKQIQQQALAAFRIIGCQGWGRLDVMLDAENRPWFLEVNTIPGMTDHSLVPMAARARGLSFDDLVLRILEAAHVE
ncbi:MAG: D-alanine--D-alanine ligase [Burkholderiales bacterium]